MGRNSGHTFKKYAALPTVSLEDIVVTYDIEAHEIIERDTIDILGVYLNKDSDEDTDGKTGRTVGEYIPKTIQ